MLTGIGDAENLAFKLALVLRGRAADALIDTFEAERRPLATEVLRGTSAVTRINIASNPIGRFLRDRVAPHVFGLKAVQRWTTYTASQLWVSYRKGPLGSGGRKPRAGDRIPDLPCMRSDGTRSRLYRELGGHWALLLPAEAPADGTLDALRQRLGDFLQVLHFRGEQMMMVRPDAHLAWRGEPSDVTGLTRWVTAALDTGGSR